MDKLFQNKVKKQFINEDNIEQRFIKSNEIAAKYGWRIKEFQPNISLAIYVKAIENFDCKINIYLTTMSVTTYINHPKKGKGQLYRKNIKYDLLDKIFKNPRQHTGKGYYKKD